MNTNNAPISWKKNAVKPIHSLTPFTLLDYPDKTACILWFAGCNMRCLYCYNPEIVLGKGKISTTTIYSFLKKRKGLLDGVVFSGGECTIHPSFLPMLHKIKSMGFKVKIDTNGSKPLILNQIIQEQLIDYIALDFKALPEHFSQITQSNYFTQFEESLSILQNSTIDFEVRTTIHTELITAEDIKKMITYLSQHNYSGTYYIQYFKNGVPTLNNLNQSDRFEQFNFSTSSIKVHLRAE